MSGGNAFFPQSIIQVQDIYGVIGRELRNQYLIGYRSANTSTDGKWRKIKIDADVADKGKIYKLATRAKTGCYARASASPAKN